MKYLVLAFLVVSASAFGCDKYQIPVEVFSDPNDIPTQTSAGTLFILAPLQYKKYILSGASFRSDDTIIPLAKGVVAEREGMASFSVTAKLSVFKNSYVEIGYMVKTKPGYTAFCSHSQKVEWGI